MQSAGLNLFIELRCKDDVCKKINERYFNLNLNLKEILKLSGNLNTHLTVGQSLLMANAVKMHDTLLVTRTAAVISLYTLMTIAFDISIVLYSVRCCTTCVDELSKNRVKSRFWVQGGSQTRT